MVVAWGLVLAAASLLVTVLLFGILPVTPIGWVMAALLGAPVYALVEGIAAFGLTGFEAPPRNSYSWSDSSSGNFRNIVRIVAQLSFAVVAIALLYFGARALINVFPWITLQFRPLWRG